jgi:hypothetical protein
MKALKGGRSSGSGGRMENTEYEIPRIWEREGLLGSTFEARRRGVTGREREYVERFSILLLHSAQAGG